MVNRRKCYRVEAYLLLTPRDGDPKDESKWLPFPELFLPSDSKFAHIFLKNPMVRVDLSENGIGFSSATEHQVDEIIEITLLFPIKQHMWCAVTICGKVVRSDRNDRSFQIGIEFMNMSDGARRRICDFILNKQRESLELEKIRRINVKRCLRAS